MQASDRKQKTKEGEEEEEDILWHPTVLQAAVRAEAVAFLLLRRVLVDAQGGAPPGDSCEVESSDPTCLPSQFARRIIGLDHKTTQRGNTKSIQTGEALHIMIV